METIKVIVDTSSNVDLALLSREERKIFFEQLQENLGLSQLVTSNFEEAQEEIISEESNEIIPSQTDLLLRKLVNNGSSRGFIDNIFGLRCLNTTVVPVIDIATETRATANRFRDDISAGIRFDNRVLVNDTKSMRIVAAKEPVNITQIIINDDCDFVTLMGHAPRITNDSLRVQNYHIGDLTCSVYDIRARTQKHTINADDASALTTEYKRIIGAMRDANGLLAARYWAARLPFMPSINVTTMMPYVNASYKPIKKLRTLESVTYARFYDGSTNAIVADITGLGFMRAWYTDDPVHLQEHQRKVKMRAEIIARKNALAVEQEKLNILRWIIEKKYGSTRLHEFNFGLNAKKMHIRGALDALSILKPAEARVVAAEYAVREKFIESRAKNTCEHKRAISRLRLARDNASVTRLYKVVSDFMPAESKTESKHNREHMIQCRVCKFDLICPHVVEHIQLDLAGASYIEMRARMTKYISDDSYFCKICGETLFSSFSDSALNDKNIVDEELSSFIWGEIMQVLRTVHFGKIVDPKKVASAARDACYPFLYDIDKQISKSKTNSAEEVRAKRKLYTAIYAYAYIIKLSTTEDVSLGVSKPKVKPTTKATTKITGGKSPSPVAVMILAAIDLIMVSKNVIIRSIPGMTADVVKNSLIAAYKSLDVGSITISSTDSENILLTLLSDPVYWYYYRVNTLARGGDRVDNVNRVLGTTIAALDKLPKTGDIFADAIVPKKYPEYKDSKTLSWHKYVAESFMAFNTRIKSRLYLEHVYAKGIPELTTEAGPFSPACAKYFASVAPMLANETILLRQRLMNFVHTYRFLQATKTRRYVAKPTLLGSIYDEQGRAHKWDLYRCESGKDITAGAIGKILESGARFTDRVVDRVCSVCGVLKSAAGDLSQEKISAILAKTRHMEIFFKYFEHRCPQGDTHTMVNGVCTLCGLGSMTRDEYYAKYSNVPMTETKDVPVVVPNPEYITPPGIEFVYNYNVVTELSETLKINHRLISALGAIEQVEYTDVESGAFTPLDITDRFEPRVFIIDTYIKNLLTEYNQLRFYQRILKPPYELMAVIEESNVPKHALGDLPKTLESPLEFSRKYATDFASMHTNAKPRDIVTFCIQRFCELCLWIWNSNGVQALRHAFIKSHVRRLFRSEELVSKPGYFSWSLLYGDIEETKTQTRSEHNDDDDEGSPMSMDAFDMEDDDGEIKIKDSYVDT